MSYFVARHHVCTVHTCFFVKLNLCSTSLRSFTVWPPRGKEDMPEINPITVSLYVPSFYVQRVIRPADAATYNDS